MRLANILFLFIIQFCYAQNNHPKDYFSSPLDVPLHLSGSFGELRNNHFHSGLDFKTKQTEGLNILACADGYVSRIKVSAWGYGKAIYITHPNGYTTVYAHLLKYAPEIEDYVKTRQYNQKSFEVEFYPRANELQVKKGQLIALSGNTGGSGGPHLHFEIRDTKSENTINPMYFGFDSLITDTKKPVVNNLYIYPIEENSYANGSENTSIVSLSLQKDGTYLAETIHANGKIAFGINTYDTFDFNYNKNGVYKIQTSLNGAQNFGITFNEFAFSETRYLNAYIDYEKLQKQKTWIQKLFIENDIPLSLIKSNQKNGIIEVIDASTFNFKIEVFDFHGNQTTIIVPIKHSTEIPKIKRLQPKSNLVLKSKIENLYEKENVSIYVAPNTFYNDFSLDFEIRDSIITFGNSAIPVHKNYTINITNSSIPEELISKTYIAWIDGKIKKFNKTEYKNNTFKTYVRSMGQFTLVQDTIAPVVKANNFKEGDWMSNQSELRINISDQHSGIKTYNAYLNNQWILMEYDYKRNLLFHDFADAKVLNGKNELKVIVTDNVGNSVNFETYFYRSNQVNE